MSHTYAILKVSKATYDEIAAKLLAAGYDHAFHGGAIDLHAIAIRVDEGPTMKDLVDRVVKLVRVAEGCPISQEVCECPSSDQCVLSALLEAVRKQEEDSKTDRSKTDRFRDCRRYPEHDGCSEKGHSLA
jgi:hypothetical protein